MIKLLFSFVIFTAFTKTYVFWASLLGLSVALITLLFFILTLLLIIYTIKDYKIALPKYWYKVIFSFFLLAPILSMLLSRNGDFRMLFLQLFYIITFVLAYIYFKRYEQYYIFNVVLASLIFTIIAGVVSVFFPTLFTQYGELTDSLTFYFGRAFGFYLQPNSLAIAINLSFIAVVLTTPKIKYIFYLLPLVLVALILAGSRTNLVGILLILFSFFPYLFLHYNKHFLKYSTQIVLVMSVLLILFLPKIIQTFSSDDFRAISKRLSYVFLQGETTSIKKAANDGSLNHRLAYQKVYLDRISEAPLIGYGFGTQQTLKEKGLIIDSAHNTPLEVLIQGGIVYFIFYIVFCYAMIKNYYRYKKTNINFTIAYRAFLIFMFWYFIFSTTFFLERIVFCVLGFFAAKSIEKTVQNVETVK